MIVFVGASASGKTELVKTLYKIYDYKKCITTTTRIIRSNEKQDVDYHFVSKDVFLDMQSKGDFIEVTHYQENLYGIQRKDVILNGVVIVDPAGANSLIDKIHDDAYVVYVETSETLRRERMIQRGDDEQIIEKRLVLDDETFQPKLIKRINLHVINEDDSLDELADLIHHNYKAYLEFKHNQKNK